MFGDHGPGHDSSRLSHHVFQDAKFLLWQNNLICAAPDPAARWVEPDTPTLQDYRHGFSWSSVECSKPRHQLRKRKWLDQVIVGPHVKANYPVADRVARCEEQDWGVNSVLSQVLADGEPVDAGEHDIQHDRVIVGDGNPV